MAAGPRRVRVVAAGEESGGSDSDSDGERWDIGGARGAAGPRPRPGAGPAEQERERERERLEEMVQAEKSKASKKAPFRGDVSIVEELSNSGTSTECGSQSGGTPLMRAARAADFAAVRLLLDRGANACFEREKFTVLMAACAAPAPEENILKTVELLLSRNADPNFACRKQMTPLMYAAKNGCARVVALLVAHGSHVNAQDEHGYSALMWAARHGHKSVILKLLELGADKNLQTKDEKTAAEIAKLNKHSEIYSLLSLAANHLQGRYRETIKQETISKFLTAASDHGAGSYSTFDAMEVFLHGLGLEHLIGSLKEKDITLRQLLTMGKDELTQIGITSPGDQHKLLDAVAELQVEEISGALPAAAELELSEEEFFRFLQKLNKECVKLAVSVQTTNKHILKTSHQVVAQWAPTERYVEACRDLVCRVAKLGEEVTRLKDLEKHGQRNDPSQGKPQGKAPALAKRSVKMGAAALLGFGFFCMTKLVVKKIRISLVL